MERVIDFITKTGEQSADDPFEFVLSTKSPDRMGDVIEQGGWNLKQFRKNPIALFQHSHHMPIGSWKNVRVVGDQLVGKLNMAKEGTSRLVDEVRSLLEQRILRAVSVGFQPDEVESLDPKNDPGGWDGIRFIKQTLLETSVVSVPANPEALAVAKSLGMSRNIRRMLTVGPVERAEPRRMVAAKSYEELLGDPSSTVRERNRLRRAGLIDTTE